MKKQIWFTHIPKNTGSSIIQIFDNKYYSDTDASETAVNLLINEKEVDPDHQFK